MDKRLKMLTALTMIAIMTVAIVYASYWIITKKGGWIYTTKTIDGDVLYSYDNKSWIYGNIYFDQTNKLYAAFNVTYISPSSAGSNFNFTFRLFNYTDNSNVTSFSVQQTISSTPAIVYCPTELSTYLVIGKTYTVYVDIYKVE
jgi:hypothetical protein